jgi:hypothetical protein
MPPPRLLPAVSAAFAPLASIAGGDIDTAAFAEACTSALPLFDCLGERGGRGEAEERGWCCLRPPKVLSPIAARRPPPSPAPRSMRQREQSHSARALGGEREVGATQRVTLTPSRLCLLPPPPPPPPTGSVFYFAKTELETKVSKE